MKTKMTSEQAYARVRELGPAIATEMSIDGATWTWVHDPELHHDGSGYLTRSLAIGERQIFLHAGYPYGRMSIQGSVSHIRNERGAPQYWSVRDNPSATVDLNREPKAIANVIRQRILPGYDKVLAEVIERATQARIDFERRNLLLIELRRTFHGTSIYDDNKLAFPGGGHAQVYHDRVNFELSTDPDLAREIVKVLERHHAKMQQQHDLEAERNKPYYGG